jgi:branched-subunit amino acid transport protein
VTIWWVVIGSAVATAAIKAAGPIALGGRDLPDRFNAIIAVMAAALLAALVVTSALADDDHWQIGADTAGVAVAGLLLWRGANVIVGVLVAAAVTAGLRAM